MNVLVGNLPGDVTEEEVLEALKEHGVPLKELTLTNEGNEEETVAVVSIDTNRAGAEAFAKLVDGRMWKGRRLTANAMLGFTGEGLNE